MKLVNQIAVPAPLGVVWDLLLDVERVALCMPGATLEAVTDDNFEGSVKVRLGAMTLTYRGLASFVSIDESTHRAALQARGKETRGGGGAEALAQFELHAEGDGTRVVIDTDLQITGKPAQFGRGVLTETAQRILDAFAVNLQQQIAGSRPGDDEPVPLSAVRSPAAEPINLLTVTGLPIAKRIVTVVGLVLLGVVLGRVARK